MIHYNYSQKQLEEKAITLLKQFDPERLTKCKPIDVYEVIEKCLDVPYDWKYLTPDQSILGLTTFKAGTLWVWPKPYFEDGMKPFKIVAEENEIIIDSTLTEHEYHGPENFTVMHEVFHQVLHPGFFLHSNPDYTHSTTRDALKGIRKPLTSLEICEYQANLCTAIFLMPKELVADRLSHYKITRKLNFDLASDRRFLLGLAEEFSVSKTAMKYRLIKLGYAYKDYWDN